MNVKWVFSIVLFEVPQNQQEFYRTAKLTSAVLQRTTPVTQIAINVHTVYYSSDLLLAHSPDS